MIINHAVVSAVGKLISEVLLSVEMERRWYAFDIAASIAVTTKAGCVLFFVAMPSWWQINGVSLMYTKPHDSVCAGESKEKTENLN